MSEQNEFGKLFPHLSSDEPAAAKEILDAYLLLAWEIWEERSARVRQDQEHSTTTLEEQSVSRLYPPRNLVPVP